MTQSTPLSELSLKSLKTMFIVAETGNVTRAAKRLNRSQTAVSKAIQSLEQKTGTTLFDRSPTGMSLTTAGQCLFSAIQEALQQFQHAARAYAELTHSAASVTSNPVFELNISYGRLQALLAVHQALGVKEAAREMQMSPATLYDSIHFLEQLLDLSLFERNAFGNEPTPFCLVLVRQTRLAFKVLQNALDEIGQVGVGDVQGKVTIAAFPSVRSFLLPQVCVQVKRQYQGIEILLKDGLYKDMELQLRAGEIDFLICAFYTPEQELSDDLQQVLLFKAPLQMIVRPEHPLFSKPSISTEDLQAYSWILPPTDSPARRRYEQLLKELHLEKPHCQIEAYSYSMQSEILRQSNSIGLAFRHQSIQDEKLGLLRALPIEPASPVSIGITERKHTTHSPPARVLLKTLREMATDMVV